jgi:uncharacterized protein YhjY with autotransporter beta-barrel domain
VSDPGTRAKRIQRTVVLVGALLASMAPALAQPAPPRLGDIGNDVQQPVAAAVQELCDRFVLEYGDPANDQLTPQQQDLFRICLGLDQTANAVLNNDLPTDFAIPGIDSEEALGAALQQQGTEELAANGTNSAQTSRGRVLLKRLAAVRGGASGIAVTDLRLGIDGTWFDLAGPTGGSGPDAPPGGGGNAPLPDPDRGATPLALPAAIAGSGESAVAFPAERWGLFVNGMFSFGTKDGTAKENGFDFDVPGLVVGADYRLRDDLILGGSLSYETFDGDYDVTTTVAGGTLEADQLALSAYSSYYGETFYLDGIVTYGRTEYEMSRTIVYPTIARRARSDTDGSRLELTGAFGYLGQRKSLQYSPFLRFSYSTTDIDPYVETEAGGASLAVGDQQIDSLQSIAGGQASWTLSRSWGVLIPLVRAEWYHEFDNDSRLITATFANDPFRVVFGVPTDEPDRDYFAVAGGVSGVLKSGRQLFAEVETLQGLKDLSNYVITVGIRFTL